MNKILNVLILLMLPITFSAQTARKPSPSRATKEELAFKPTTTIKSLSVIKTQAEFDSLGRVYNQNTPYALPHIMFIIDRKNKNKIYYINSKLYTFHKDFVNANYLSLERGEEFFRNNYINANRQFIIGTLAYQIPLKKWTYEFWEGDLIPAELIKQTSEIINKSFFQPVAYKPNSIKQEDDSAKLGISRILESEISAGQEYVALNPARGIGRIHVIEKLDDTVEIGYNEILVLKEVPIALPPVMGIIMAQPSTPLSHINLLAKGWGIPNAYIKNADALFKDLDGTWVEFETKLNNYTIKHADKKTLDEYDADQKKKGLVVKSPPSNLNVKKLALLAEFSKKDSIIYGAKAANLAEVKNAKIPNVIVPNGFAVPFYYYDKFMSDNGFDDEAAGYLYDNNFVHNPRIRRKMLEDFRAKIQKGKFDEKLKAEILKKWKAELGGKPVYARSSSNSEDLPNFSGAGIYTSVKNIVEDEKLIEGIKTVWASMWNFEAYEARERNLINHADVYMAVLVQLGVNMDNGGVMITQDPFDKNNKGSVYISATFGHNLSVTGGDGELKKKPIPEQILFSPRSNSVQVLTRSDQDTMFVADPNGGLKEVPFSPDRRVLTNEKARALVKSALSIKRIFGNKEQDIEWGYMNGQIFILQARPMVGSK